MLFSSDNGEELEFKVLGYEFPDSIDGDWDSNWLRIYIRVVSQTGSWKSVDPSLTTWELRKAIKWFQGIFGSGNEIEPELTFTEPNLSFRLTGRDLESAEIQIHFDLESRPKSATDDQDYFVEILLSNNAVERTIKDLQTEYEKFPERI